MADILRILYIGLAGLEIGFLLTLAHYRYYQAKEVDDWRGPAGLGFLAVSFILFLLGTIIGIYSHLGDGVTIPLIIFTAALLVLVVGTYLVNVSNLGVRHFLVRMRNHKL